MNAETFLFWTKVSDVMFYVAVGFILFVVIVVFYSWTEELKERRSSKPLRKESQNG